MIEKRERHMINMAWKGWRKVLALEEWMIYSVCSWVVVNDKKNQKTLKSNRLSKRSASLLKKFTMEKLYKSRSNDIDYV